MIKEENKVIWHGSEPEKCDICGNLILNEFVDGKTRMGPWGILCLNCYNLHGMGLGIGKGQLYTKQYQWVKTGG